MKQEIELSHLFRDRDRHGTLRTFVRRYGRKIRIRAQPGTVAFIQAYSEALDALEQPAVQAEARLRGGPPRGSMGHLAGLYFGSVEFKALAAASQKNRRQIIESCLGEPVKATAPEGAKVASIPANVFSSKHMIALRERCGDKHGAANNRLKYFSSMFGWAIEALGGELITRNPCRDVKRRGKRSGGFHTWTPEEVTQFEARWPIGTKERLAMTLLLYLGVRRQDVIGLGRQHEREGGAALAMTPKKTQYLPGRDDRQSWKPILPELRAVLDASPCGDLTYLLNEYGAPFTVAGFGMWFRKACDRAGLKQCTAHGLRKAGATRAAERGATDRQLMALFDWDSSKQANDYVKQANQKQLAIAGAAFLSDAAPAAPSAPVASTFVALRAHRPRGSKVVRA
jgi:integrase